MVESAKLIFNQWKSAQDRSFDNSLGFMTQSDGKEYWECPTEGMVKINTDVATFTDSNRFSFSMLAHDHHGELLEAYASCRQGNMDPVIAEAIGIREALSWVKGKEWSEVVMETDCLTVVHAMRCSSTRLSYLGRVIDDCKLLLSQLHERNITLNFVKRSANKVAHHIARHTSSIADRIWREGVSHPDLSHVLLHDLKF